MHYEESTCALESSEHVLWMALRPAGERAVNWSDSINSSVGGGRARDLWGTCYTAQIKQHNITTPLQTMQHDSTQRISMLINDGANTDLLNTTLSSFGYTSVCYKFKIALNWKQCTD